MKYFKNLILSYLSDPNISDSDRIQLYIELLKCESFDCTNAVQNPLKDSCYGSIKSVVYNDLPFEI